MSYSGIEFYKCAVEPELGLLGIECDDGEQFICMDLNTRQVIFETSIWGKHLQHWVTNHDQKFLSLKTDRTTLKMFKFNAGDKSFKEDESLRIAVEDFIVYTQFDCSFENIFLLMNKNVLEKRSLNELNTVQLSIKLEEKVEATALGQMVLSSDGTVCALGGGNDKQYFYLVNFASREQHKMTSSILTDTYAPCFINGATEYVAVGAWGDVVEIWDIRKRQSVRTLDLVNGTCSASKNNILAFASSNGVLRLRDVRNWEVQHSKTFEGLYAYSLHLTADLKYLTIGGKGGDNCVVMKIK